MGGMDPDTFGPLDVIHLFVMEIDLYLSVADPGGVAAVDHDKVGEISDEGLFNLHEGDEDEELSVIDNMNDTIAQLVASEDTRGISEHAANADHVDGPLNHPANDPAAQRAEEPH